MPEITDPRLLQQLEGAPASGPHPITLGAPDPTIPAKTTKANADAIAASGTAPYAAPTAAAGLRGQTLSNLKTQQQLDGEARDRADAEDAVRQKRAGQQFQSNIILKNIQEARALIGEGGTTGWSSLMAGLPESRARRLRNILDTVRSNLTFDKLQQMRDQSKTGGAVGNASDADMRLLGATVGSLDQGQKDVDILNVLGDVESNYLNFLADNEGVDRGKFAQGYQKNLAERAPAGAATQSPQQPWTREQSIARWGEELFDQNGQPLGPDGGPSFDAHGKPRGFAANVASDPSSAQAPAPYRESLAGQGMSGVNEGIGSTLGAPVDIATAGLNLIPKGINALTNTNLPQIEQPFMGGDWWQQRLRDAGAIFPGTDAPTNQFARRVGQSVGSSLIPVAGTASTLGRAGAGLLSAAGGGVGAATAQQVAPGNPLAEMGGELIGGGLAGTTMFANAGRKARMAAEAAVPSTADLRNKASDLYSQAENLGIVGGPNVTSNLSGRLEDIARRAEVVDSPLYPHANEAVKIASRYSGQSINPTQIQVVREGLADAVQATEGRQRKIARDMLKAFDEETVPLAPELGQARNIASRYLQAGQVQKAIDLAEPGAAQMTQSGMANALKTQFRGLDRRIIKGDETFNPAVVKAITDVSRGTPTTNALQHIGKMAPAGVVSTGIATGVPFAIGNAIGGPAVGGALSGATLATGTAGRMFANRAVEKNAQTAELLARNGGPLQTKPLLDDEVMRQIAAQIAAAGAPYAQR